MLHLAAPTRPDWVEQALGSFDLVLLDHAHCEKKAASVALSLVFRYAHFEVLARPLSGIVREEMEHFEQVLALLAARGVPYRRLPPSAYGHRLHEHVRPHEPERLLDLLLCAALIEARSCERMKLLSEAHPDAELAAYYRSLLASEARHHATYVDLALSLNDKQTVRDRLDELAALEAEVLRTAKGPPRMHS